MEIPGEKSLKELTWFCGDSFSISLRRGGLRDYFSQEIFSCCVVMEWILVCRKLVERNFFTPRLIVVV